MAQSIPTTRNLKMDNAKFILIVLVILGHCLERFTPQGVNGCLFNTIYIFHMPLFIFITGYFTNTNKEIKKYADGVLNLFITFCFFHILWFVINGSTSFRSLVYPAWTLWYLLSTTCWKCLIYIFRNVKPEFLFVCSLILSLLGGFIPITAFSIPRTFTFAPFFVLGYIARIRSFDFNKTRTIYLLIPTIFILFGCILFLKGDYSWLLFGLDNYTAYHCSLLYAPIMRLCLMVVSLLISVCILAYCPTFPIMAKCGSNTLFYYLYHTFVIFAIDKCIVYFDIPKSTLLLIFSLAIMVISLLIAERITLFHKMAEPYKSIKGMRK